MSWQVRPFYLHWIHLPDETVTRLPSSETIRFFLSLIRESFNCESSCGISQVYNYILSGDIYQVSASPVILHLEIHTLHQPENLDTIKPSNELSQVIVLDYDFNWNIFNFYLEADSPTHPIFAECI